MNQVIKMVLDFPATVNAKILNARLNSEINRFDSPEGIGHYVKTLYLWFSFLVLVAIEYSAITDTLHYFQSDADGLSKGLSIVTSLLLIYAGFPISQIIRNHGEALGNSYNGIINFIFRDFIVTNIRILGEAVAVGGFIYAVSMTLGWITDHDLLMSAPSLVLSETLGNFNNLPVEGLAALLAIFNLEIIAGYMQEILGYSISQDTTFGGDWSWNSGDIFNVAGAYISVIMGLAAMYINIAIYNFIYGLISSLANWIKSPSLPIKMK